MQKNSLLRADHIGAGVTYAVAGVETVLPIGTCRAGSPAAIDTGLRAVPDPIVASAGDHRDATVVGAGSALAVAAMDAALANGAGGAGPAPAVDVGLVAIPDSIVAGGGRSARIVGAHRARAVGGMEAMEAARAGFASAAAIHVRLVAVLDFVRACAREDEDQIRGATIATKARRERFEVVTAGCAQPQKRQKRQQGQEPEDLTGH